MIVLLNYADQKYKKAQALNSRTGKLIARFDKVISCGPNDVDESFRIKHKKIFDVKRGNGLWLWKPYLVYKTLGTMNEGDILFYCDSAAFFIRNAKKYFTVMMDDIWVSDLPLLEKQFTSEYALEMMDCRSEIYMETNQIQASFFAIRKTENTVQFVKEWLDYCTCFEILDGMRKKDEVCISHREDQSILSLMCKKKGISPHKDPSQYGKLPEKYYHSRYYIYAPSNHSDRYKPFIVLHRTNDNNFGICFRQLLCAVLPRKISLRYIIGLNR